jgi:citrate synthase
MSTAGTGAGLEGIVATTSSICFIDGDAGVLSYRGYNIHTLADNATFEEVVYLLWHGELPTKSQLESLKAELKSVPKATPMDVLRTAVSMLGLFDPQAADSTPEANRKKAVKLVSKIATIVTSFDRLRNGKEIVPNDPALSHPANFLYTLTGKRPDDVMERVFDIALTLHADHELNASTFAARVTAATLSDIYSATVSAIGALKGPLHGGANEAVIRMLLSTRDAEQAVTKVKSDLANKIKVPGFGHRVYRVLDPRAIHLKKLSEELGKRTGSEDLYQKSTRVEQMVKQEKNLNANVDFYSASAYYSLGIPVDLFTPIFAVSRISGWTAHILEQYHNNRLIRPRADYTGAADGRSWTPIGSRQ